MLVLRLGSLITELKVPLFTGKHGYPESLLLQEQETLFKTNKIDFSHV